MRVGRQSRAGALLPATSVPDAPREQPGCTYCGETKLNTVMGAIRVCTWCSKEGKGQEMKVQVPSKSEGGDWELAPAGTQHAVLVDVIDMGEVEVDVYGKPGVKEKQHHAKFAFQLAERMTTGKPFLLSTWGMKVSLHDKAKMRKLLAALNGKDFEVGAEIDPDTFIGCNCLLDVIHKRSADGSKTYANIGNVMGVPKGMPIIAPDNYVRVQDRPKDAENAHADGGPSFDTDDSEIPFD